MNILEKRRLITSLVVIIKNKLSINIPKKLLLYLQNLDYKFNDEINSKNINIYNLEQRNIDSELLKKKLNQNKKLEDQLHDVIDLNGIELKKDFDKIIDNPFASLRVKRNIINNLSYVLNYTKNNINIKIISDKYEYEVLKNIISILNLFNLITKKENKYMINIYLSDEVKNISDYEYLNADNINSGSTLPTYFITLWRKEELYKVLIHELIHYLKLDMSEYQNKFRVLYKDVKLVNNKCNPNEAYTEFLALIFFNYWKFIRKRKESYKLENFLKCSLLIEMGWSYFQIGKILNFFGCYNNYEDLFNSNCEFKQKTNVLSYFILKTYLLFNISNTIDCINFDTLKQSNILTNKLLNSINLNSTEFSKIINWCISYYTNTTFRLNHKTLRMTCLDI